MEIICTRNRVRVNKHIDHPSAFSNFYKSFLTGKVAKLLSDLQISNDI